MTTTTDVKNWYAPIAGTWVDTGEEGSTECVDLSKLWVMYKGGPEQAYGHGKDMAKGIADALKDWEFITPDKPALPGDVASWGGGFWGRWGHTAVVVSDEGSTLTVVQQNPKAAHIKSGVTKTGLVGYARKKSAVKPTAAPSATGTTHTVVKGETVTKIAEKYGTTVDAIKKLNPGMDVNNILVGQKIVVKGSAPKTYTVAKGDNLTKIAEKYGTTVAALVSLNGLRDPNNIVVGQTLKVA